MFGYRVRNAIVFVFLAISFIFGNITTGFSSTEMGEQPVSALPPMSADGDRSEVNVPTKIIVNDPNPSSLRRIPLPEGLSMDPETAKTTFSIYYIPEGQNDRRGRPCYTFPNEARTVFDAAAAVWANIIESSVPITITACWTIMDNPNILGSAGAGNYWANFDGAAKSDTYYVNSLVNAMHGADLEPDEADMHITYNSAFDWYYGTDGNTPPAQHDLFTVVLHEIAHGLNFSGSMMVEDGLGKMFFELPVVYDLFMEDNAGKLLTSYPNDSTALANALTSDGIYFNGSNASAANGGNRVKMYAPSGWNQGSSYSHLDYSYNNTPHQLMVWAVSAGESVHDPGTITRGLLKDVGWNQPPSCDSAPTQPNSISYPSLVLSENFTVSWPAVEDVNEYIVQRSSDPGFSRAMTIYSGPATSIQQSQLSKGTYYYRVCASNGCGNSAYRAGGAITVTVGVKFPWPTVISRISKNATPPPTNKAQWGAGNEVCCTSTAAGWASFSLTSQGKTRESKLDSCTDPAYSWQGWVPSTTGLKNFSWILNTSKCGVLMGSLSYKLQDKTKHLFYAHWTGYSVEIWVKKSAARSAADGSNEKVSGSDIEFVEQELIDVIPVDTNGATLGKCMIDDTK